MLNTTPILVLRRSRVLRIIVALGLAIPIVLCALGAFASFSRSPMEPAGGTIFAAAAIGCAILLAWIFRRETSRQTVLYSDGIAQRTGSRTREILWTDVREVVIKAVRIRAGGLIGMAISSAVEAATKSKEQSLNEKTTSIHVTVTGGAGKIKITSNDRGVTAALAEIDRRVTPRLTETVVRQVQEGLTAAFGKFTVSLRGIAVGRGQPVPYTDIERLYLDKGKVYLKKRGSWLASGGALVSAVPNVLVLLAVHRRLAGITESAAGPNQGLVRGAFIGL